MKNLKTYKIFESEAMTQDTIDEIMDMGKDLTDDGFLISYLRNNSSIDIMKIVDSEFIKIEYTQIKDFVDRTISYLHSEGFKTQIKFVDESKGSCEVSTQKEKSISFRIKIR